MDTWLAKGPAHIGAMWVAATTEDEAIEAGLELFRCADPSLTKDQVSAQFAWKGVNTHAG